jgi:SAM-dependent methyltransferase
MPKVLYVPASHWDKRFSKWHRNGEDLDWGTQWVAAFLEHDVIRLKNNGFNVFGLDYSRVAIAHAAKKLGGDARFIVGDMSKRLPFPASAFDVVMSNVAAHMFSDAITRSLFMEVERILKTGGLFVFHLNALEDRPLRELRWPAVRELEPNYVLEAHGQTMRFFSEEYLRDLLSSWTDVKLTLIDISVKKTGDLFKRVWRGIATK